MTSNELCLPTTCNFKNTNSLIPKFIVSNLSCICSFIFSHPIYFLYFIFFSPYLFKFVFFISPLFFTTTLLLLCIVATTLPQPKFGFIQTVLDKLRSKVNDVDEEAGDAEFRDFEDLEIYKIVFNDSQLINISTTDKNNSNDKSNDRLKQVLVMDNTVAVRVLEKSEEERSLEKLFEQLDRFEDSNTTFEMQGIEKRLDHEKMEDELRKLEPIVSKKLNLSCEDQKTIDTKMNSWRSDSSSSFGSYGSMRKEKEWKRTLACKLFEERHNSEGGEEGMDSLWEAYEEDNSSRKLNNKKETMNDNKKAMIKNKNKKKSEFKYFFEGDDVDEDDDEKEFMSNGQLCCLKVLKLSTGKMNLGMGKPNLVKISKAIKGFGWLHHVGSKHGKKV
ncbi:uncharacterized protein [Rutidosis leptorrhynchoides]|uniref:uncharacterized protein n=1 Tax=Rutidosis leptorrhynchoides TaxID=125765 RepID=UPI003A9947BD